MKLRLFSSSFTVVLVASLTVGSVQSAPAKQSTSNVDTPKHDASAPIQISSDTFEGDTQTKVGTYVGNVVIIQGDYRLRADKVNLHATSGKLNTIDGVGNVLFNSGLETASGDTGIYDLTARTVTLDGKVVLTKEKNVMRGTHLVMNLDTHKALLTAKGMVGGGRVQALFIPPPKDQSATPHKSQTNSKSPEK